MGGWTFCGIIDKFGKDKLVTFAVSSPRGKSGLKSFVIESNMPQATLFPAREEWVEIFVPMCG